MADYQRYFKVLSRADLKFTEDHYKWMKKHNEHVLGKKISMSKFKQAFHSPHTSGFIRAQLASTLFEDRPINVKKFAELATKKNPIWDDQLKIEAVNLGEGLKFRYMHRSDRLSEWKEYKLSQQQEYEIKLWAPSIGEAKPELLRALQSGKPASINAAKLIFNINLFTNATVYVIHQFNLNNDPKGVYHDTSEEEVSDEQRAEEEIAAAPRETQRISRVYRTHLSHLLGEFRLYTEQLTRLGFDVSKVESQFTKLLTSIDTFESNDILNVPDSDYTIQDEYRRQLYTISANGDMLAEEIYTLMKDIEELDITASGIDKKGGLNYVCEFTDYKPDKLEKRKAAIISGDHERFVEGAMARLRKGHEKAKQISLRNKDNQ